MTIWSKLISEGTINFSNSVDVENKIIEIENATKQLLIDITSLCNISSSSSIERAISLKTKGKDHKSPYEAINQLLHYWHCMVAGKQLIKLDLKNLSITGGAEDSGQPADINATTKDGKIIFGEVYCVSEALWRKKTSDTIKKLNSKNADSKFILFNLEAKKEYKSKSRDIAFYGVDRNLQKVFLLCYKKKNEQEKPEFNLSGQYA